MCSFQQKSQGYQGVMVNEMGLITLHDSIEFEGRFSSWPGSLPSLDGFVWLVQYPLSELIEA
ncbi:MAG: hypothetical protein QF578_00550, partial [Alphaproteobacteria bacterium]|nr:hypothetical protein [Alphaproteobacteria bacterium]